MAEADFATGRMDLGEIEVRLASDLEAIASTPLQGSNCTSFFKPSHIPAGFHCLGYCAHSSNHPLDQVHLLIAKDKGSETTPQGANISREGEAEDSADVSRGISAGNPPLKFPKSYDLVWCFEQKELLICFWLPLPSDGFKTLGLVVTTTKEIPPLEEICCVRQDLTEQAMLDECVWMPSQPLGRWLFRTPSPSIWNLKPQIVSIHGKGVSVGAFTCCFRQKESCASTAILRNVSLKLDVMPNLQQVHDLVKKYAPIVFFHPQETFLPCSVAWFFTHETLLHSHSSPTPRHVSPDGSNLPQGGSNDGQYWLDLPEDPEAAELVKRGDLESAEAYVHVKPMHGGAFTDLQFWLFCAFNGGGSAMVGRKEVSLGQLGQHVSDWEHFTLRISNLSGNLTRVYFSQHRCGTWVPLQELEWVSERLVVYSGKGGHSIYHRQGCNLQGKGSLGVRFGLLNCTARSNLCLDTSAAYRIVSAEYLRLPEPPWLQFMRKWGPRVVYSTKRKVDAIAKGFPTSLQTRLQRLPKTLYGEEGPTGPKQKDSWIGDERAAAPPP